MKLLFLFGFLCSCSLVSGVFDYYNCLRTGQTDCNADPCTAGACVCAGGKSGYNCKYDSGNQGTGCDAGCTECRSDDVCQCAADKYSSTTNDCAKDRLQLRCSVEGKMLINANIEGANAVFIDDDCILDGTAGSDNLPSDWSGPMRAVSTTDGICPIEETDNADGTKTNCVEVRVRFAATIWDSRDALIRYCCTGAVVSIEAASLTVDDGLVQGTTVVPPAGSDSDIERTSKVGGVVVSGDISVGDILTIDMTLAANADFVDLMPITCDLSEASSGGTQSNALVTTGCATDFYQAEVTYTAAGAVSLSFEVVKYVGFDTLFVLCDIRLCVVEANCDASCPGRKKREASANSTAETYRQLVFPFKVKNPFEQNSVDAAVDKAVAEETTINLSAAVIGLAVVVLILLAACLLLGVCLINKRRAPDLKA